MKSRDLYREREGERSSFKVSCITILFLFSIAIALLNKALVFVLFCFSLLWSFISFKVAGFLSCLLKDVDTMLRSKQHFFFHLNSLVVFSLWVFFLLGQSQYFHGIYFCFPNLNLTLKCMLRNVAVSVFK